MNFRIKNFQKKTITAARWVSYNPHTLTGTL
jgi:hypothetical protein